MKKMNKFTKKAQEMEAWGCLLAYAIEQREWNMETQTDPDTGEFLKDENDDYIRTAPAEDSYSYNKYVAWGEVIKTLESMKI